MVTRRFVISVCTAVGLILLLAVSTSAVDGRWKLGDNGECTFDPGDSGPDQCDPTPGRWKDDGSGGCYFDAADSGPDQCTPPPATTEPGVVAARDASSTVDLSDHARTARD
jgi:hypothetical protein